MLLSAMLFIVGLFLLAYGSDRLVFSAAVLSRMLGISPLVIGGVIIGLGTSLPEIILSFSASQQGLRELAVGLALGSNIINVLLILGIALVLRPLSLHSALLRHELPLMLLVTVLAGLALINHQLTVWDGLALLFVATLYLYGMFRLTQHTSSTVPDQLTQEQLSALPDQHISFAVALLWLGVALILLPVATHMIVDNALVVANFLGLSQRVIGLLFLSIGTSLPELATVVVGMTRGQQHLAIGNLVGAQIYNLAIVLGIPAIFNPGAISEKAFNYDFWLVFISSSLLTLLCLKQNKVNGRIMGIILLTGFLGWALWLCCPLKLDMTS
ncbi:calcium/sodium antiporter [Rosenbergiella collisarenosi]|uniref:calcium/sodium antiporter n=1 Tax=Rosenbergiella collisarenosi TaxID=1544695 RepID=UPI001BDA160F|nr:calcium/sodium antiporter [Rosenbergiella collisarenosi]MBT0719757.1 calcium/sodium antiporter [Rosenbergiella collisarenosi]